MTSGKCIKILIIILLLVIAAAVPAAAQNNNDQDQSAIKRFEGDRTVENKAFSLGEKLTFELDFGYVNAGTATLSIPEMKNINGREILIVKARALSNKVVSAFYPVDDNVISYIDKDGIYSWRMEKHLSEGKYKTDRMFLFDQENNLAFTSKDTVEVPEFCQDILSSFYYVRTQELKVGDTVRVPNFDNGKVYISNVNILKTQKIRVPAGTFDCLVVEPKLEGQELFKYEGKIKIFLSNDERKIPVLMTLRIIFADVTVKLTSIENETEK